MKFFLLFIIILSQFSFSQVNSNYHLVKGYYRSDGTYVQPNYRTNHNYTYLDNYTTLGNTNPWTGKPGYINPDSNAIIDYTVTLEVNKKMNSRKNYSREFEDFRYGYEYAAIYYKPSFLNILIPAAVTTYKPLYGLSATLTFNFLPLKNKLKANKNFEEGYNSNAGLRRFMFTLYGFLIGLVGNVVYILVR